MILFIIVINYHVSLMLVSCTGLRDPSNVTWVVGNRKLQEDDERLFFQGGIGEEGLKREQEWSHFL